MEILKFLQTHLTIKGESAIKIHMVGVDLDPNLISRAKEKYQQSVELHTLDVSQEVTFTQYLQMQQKILTQIYCRDHMQPCLIFVKSKAFPCTEQFSLCQ